MRPARRVVTSSGEAGGVARRRVKSDGEEEREKKTTGRRSARATRALHRVRCCKNDIRNATSRTGRVNLRKASGRTRNRKGVEESLVRRTKAEMLVDVESGAVLFVNTERNLSSAGASCCGDGVAHKGFAITLAAAMGYNAEVNETEVTGLAKLVD